VEDLLESGCVAQVDYAQGFYFEHGLEIATLGECEVLDVLGGLGVVQHV